jgi:hypothetical protein
MANGTRARWFEEVGIAEVPDVGGKNASLGEMYRELADKGSSKAARSARRSRTARSA